MKRVLFLWLGLAFLLLSACEAEPEKGALTPAPALWSIEKDGQKGWLFGTVHLLPEGTEWQSPAIAAAIDESGLLVLEATGLDNQRRTSQIFERMAKSPDLLPLAQRLPPSRQEALDRLLTRLHMNEAAMGAYESWAAALLLSSGIQQDLKLAAGEGIDRQLNREFLEAGKAVAGLETVEQQLGIFDTLPQAAQQQLLLQVVDEAAGADGRYRQLLDAWLRGDMDRIGQEFLTEFGKTPELITPLLIERNRSWARQISALIRRADTPFIAVGAGHLAGPRSLQIMLAAQGFRVRRVQ